MSKFLFEKDIEDEINKSRYIYYSWRLKHINISIIYSWLMVATFYFSSILFSSTTFLYILVFITIINFIFIFIIAIWERRTKLALDQVEQGLSFGQMNKEWRKWTLKYSGGPIIAYFGLSVFLISDFSPIPISFSFFRGIILFLLGMYVIIGLMTIYSRREIKFRIENIDSQN